MCHLFICGTLLQARIAESIIKANHLPASECATFFYANRKTEQYCHYFDRLSHFCDKSMLFFADGHTAKSLFQAKKALKSIRFKNVYLASPISAYSIIALGLGRHTALYTFDDGTANIFPISTYSKDYKLSVKKSVALKILGSSYTPARIKAESIGHYTIYPHFKNNISDKLIPIELFSPPPKPRSDLKCSVILGTVFHEVFDYDRPRVVLGKIQSLFKNKNHDIFFLRHPRDRLPDLNQFQTIDTSLMAEDAVLDLLFRYSEIDLYGFCSSAQVNLAHIQRINPVLIRTVEYEESYNEMAQLFEAMNRSFKTLEL